VIARRLNSFWVRANRYWFGPTLAWPLALFRILFGVTLLCYFTERLSGIDEFLGASAARIPELGVSPESPLLAHQPVYLPPLAPLAQLLVLVVFFASCAALIVGYRARLAASLLAVWVMGVTFADWMGAFAENRSAPLVLLVLALAPAARVWSIDSWRSRRSADVPGARPSGDVLISAWSVRTLQWFLLLWYLSSAFQKLNGGWSLFGSNDVVWSQLQGWYTNDLGWWALHHLPKWFFGSGEVLTIYFEAFAPLWLIPRRVRPFGLLFGFALHAMLALFMSNLWTLSLEMISFYALFLPLGARALETAPSAAEDSSLEGVAEGNEIESVGAIVLP
jgi:hypothetical protein